MSEPQPQYLDVPRHDGGASRIAYLSERRGRGPGLVWLSGFLSTMVSTKASALAAWGARQDATVTRFDFSGHGQSEGRIEDATIGTWLAEASAVFRQLTEGPQIVVGSSMGGWIALLLARKLSLNHPEHADRLAGMVLIAPAWDMTEKLIWPSLPETARTEIAQNGVTYVPSAYEAPYPITRRLIEEGRAHTLIGAPFDPGCPVHILQGMHDTDVPWEHALALVDLLSGDDVELTLVKDGDHRLSRPRDIARLEATLDGLRG